MQRQRLEPKEILWPKLLGKPSTDQRCGLMKATLFDFP